MTREDFIELLKSYKENKAKLTIKLKELKNTRMQLKNNDRYETSVTSSFGINQDIHSKNQISDKVGRKIEENDTKLIQIQEKIKKLEDEVKKIRDKVEAVEDRLEGLKYKERELLAAYYIDGRTAENISRTLYYEMYQRTCTPRYVQKIIEKATKRMLNI